MTNSFMELLESLDDEDTSWLSTPETTFHRIFRLYNKMTHEQQCEFIDNFAEAINALYKYVDKSRK